MITFHDLAKNASKTASTSGEKVLDVIHAEAMRDYIGEHVFGVKRRSTFSVLASGTGLVLLGALVGGALVFLAGARGRAALSSEHGEFSRDGRKNKDIKKDDLGAKDSKDENSARREAVTRMSNNVEPSPKTS